MSGFWMVGLWIPTVFEKQTNQNPDFQWFLTKWQQTNLFFDFSGDLKTDVHLNAEIIWIPNFYMLEIILH